VDAPTSAGSVEEVVLGTQGQGIHGTRGSAGFSLPELLAVFAIIAIALAIGVPLVNEQIRIAEVRSVADELVLHLRTARVLSVTKHATIDFNVYADPTNSFEYGVRSEPLKKKFFLPSRVRIAGGSDPTFEFKANGSVSAPSTVIIEADVSGSRERWTATVSTMGKTQLSHERVN
jgi:prepilin-type N-terminal cleavage/methylation domain-containing protein